MFAAIGRFFASLTRLADGIDALEPQRPPEVNTRLRSQLQLDAPADPWGVIEHRPDDAEADAPAKRNGKRERATN